MWKVYDCTNSKQGYSISPWLISEDRCNEWLKENGENGRIYESRFTPYIEAVKEQ